MGHWVLCHNCSGIAYMESLWNMNTYSCECGDYLLLKRMIAPFNYDEHCNYITHEEDKKVREYFDENEMRTTMVKAMTLNQMNKLGISFKEIK